MSKESFKNLTKKKVLYYWERRLRSGIATKSSLKYFKADFMTLQRPHPLFTTCGANPWETNKALVKSRLLSGRYQTDWLKRHWSPDNKEGWCILCLPDKSVPGSIEHFLGSCSSLKSKRAELLCYWDRKSEGEHSLKMFLNKKKISTKTEFTQFLLDPSVDPQVIQGIQAKLFDIKKLFKLTRTFIYGLHRQKLQLSEKLP